MHVDELHLRRRDVEQRVTLRWQFAEPAADQNDEIALLDERHEFWIWTNAEVTGVTRVLCIEEMAAAECGGDRQREPFRKSAKRGASGGRPAAAAEQNDRLLRRPDHF